MIKANYVDPKDLVMSISEQKQQEMREADYINGKKCIVYYKDEEFRLYSKNLNYAVGNYGDCYSFNRRKKISPSLDKDGYYQCYLGGVPQREHRAVMETFNPVENSNELQVNHIDCNKTRNIFDPARNRVNIEWCTCQENIEHAIKTGHRLPSGENHHKAKYKEKNIWKICELMSQNKTGRQIANELGIEYTPQFQDLTTKIRKKESWQFISDQFPEIKVKRSWGKINK